MDAIELTRQALGIDAKSFNADLVDIAYRLEQIIAPNDKGGSKQVMTTLIELAGAYLRGRGYKMGNWRGVRAHKVKQALICTSVIMKVEEKGEIFFPALHRLGFGSVEQGCSTMKGLGVNYDILDEAERILREEK